MHIEQDPEKRIEQHASWIAVNPIIGCPYSCEYCFLGPDNLRPKRPNTLRSPDQTMQDLFESKYYAPDIPVAIGTYTDMFATPKNRGYVREWLEVWRQTEPQNPLIFITKGEIPDDIAETMGGMHASGLPMVAFLSISGLNREIEKGVKHEKLIQNIGRLARYNVPVVHYWRPLMPQNSTSEVMERVHSLVAGRTSSSFVGGLRLTEAMKQQITNWPDILEVYAENLDSAWDKNGYDRVSELRTHKPNHPIYEAASCTMANATKTPEYNGIYGSDICARSNCPTRQRAICGTDQSIPWEKISDSARRLHFKFDVDPATRVIKPRRTLEVDELTNIMHSTRMTVETPYVIENHYPWGTHHTRDPIFIDSEISLAKKPKQLFGLPIDRLQKLQIEYKEASGVVVGELSHLVHITDKLLGDCTGLGIITGPEMLDFNSPRYVSKWQFIYTSTILYNVLNMLSCVDTPIRQEFIDQIVCYIPHSEGGWRSDLGHFSNVLCDTTAPCLESYTNVTVGEIVTSTNLDTLLVDLAGCVMYGYKESGLGNISITRSQFATKLRDFMDSM
jgi:DNA repair photolyase